MIALCVVALGKAPTLKEMQAIPVVIPTEIKCP